MPSVRGHLEGITQLSLIVRAQRVRHGSLAIAAPDEGDPGARIRSRWRAMPATRR